MINPDDLVPDEWYDGFLWKDGKQRGTATLRCRAYSGGLPPYFTSAQHGTVMLKDEMSRNLTFEPNVISIGEPAA